jgi:acyl-CoA synthetase (AMP-forming)/AMP-acid ligase II
MVMTAISNSRYRGPAARLRQDNSLFETVKRHATRAPDKAFLILETDSGQHITSFSALLDQAYQYEDAFRQRGVQPGDTAALLFTMHPALAPAFLGAIMAGALPFILPTMTVKQDPVLFWQAQSATLHRTQAKVILTDANTAVLLAEYAPDLVARLLDVAEIKLDQAAQNRASPVLPRHADAFLQHSSGTTGAKKGVLLTHAMVLDFVAALGSALDVREDDIIASWLPLYHDMGLIGCLILPMLLGITTVHISPFDWVTRPVSLFELIERHRATLCWQPNFAFQHLVRTAPRDRSWDLSSIRAFINCSESCKPDTNRLFLDRFGACGLAPENLQVSYGMAENVFIATQTDITRPARAIIADLDAFDEGRIEPPVAGFPSLAILSTGFPIPDTNIEIRDEQGTRLPDRRIGQITVNSPYMFAGYHKSDLAEKTLVNGWYKTGDFGFIDGGEVFVCGRRDELLIINGRNIYAPDVEFSINKNTAVKPGRCVAIGPYNPRTGSQSLVVVAEIEDPSEPARQALAGAIKTLINAEFGLLAHDVWITDIGWVAKTTSGKIARGANEARYLKERWAR